jgi:AraC-like DNA-binding protein
VYFDPGVIAWLGAGTSRVPHAELTRPVVKDHELGLALRELFARLESWSIGRCVANADVMACEESLVCTFGLLLSRYATDSCSEEACGDVKRARDRLADELLSPPTLAELALMTGVSKYQLLRRFERAYGVPPSAWLRMQRTERARVLIADGQSLAQAAASCGFADQSHMTRNFVDQFGFTPGAWQRTVARARPRAQN